MGHLTEEEIKNTKTPLHQFLKGDNEARLSICQVFDRKRDRRDHAIQMLSSADLKELDELDEIVSDMIKFYTHHPKNFLNSIERGSAIRRLLLNLSTDENPEETLHSLLDDQDRMNEFAPLLNTLPEKEYPEIAKKLVSFMSKNDIALLTRILEKTQSCMQQTQHCHLLTAVKAANTPKLTKSASWLNLFAFGDSDRETDEGVLLKEQNPQP